MSIARAMNVPHELKDMFGSFSASEIPDALVDKSIEKRVERLFPRQASRDRVVSNVFSGQKNSVVVHKGLALGDSDDAKRAAIKTLRSCASKLFGSSLTDPETKARTRAFTEFLSSGGDNDDDADVKRTTRTNLLRYLHLCQLVHAVDSCRLTPKGTDKKHVFDHRTGGGLNPYFVGYEDSDEKRRLVKTFELLNYREMYGPGSEGELGATGMLSCYFDFVALAQRRDHADVLVARALEPTTRALALFNFVKHWAREDDALREQTRKQKEQLAGKKRLRENGMEPTDKAERGFSLNLRRTGRQRDSDTSDFATLDVSAAGDGSDLVRVPPVTLQVSTGPGRPLEVVREFALPSPPLRVRSHACILRVYPTGVAEYDDDDPEACEVLRLLFAITPTASSLAGFRKQIVERISKLYGQCVMCGSALKNESSVEQGMGPTCFSRVARLLKLDAGSPSAADAAADDATMSPEKRRHRRIDFFAAAIAASLSKAGQDDDVRRRADALSRPERLLFNGEQKKQQHEALAALVESCANVPDAAVDTREKILDEVANALPSDFESGAEVETALTALTVFAESGGKLFPATSRVYRQAMLLEVFFDTASASSTSSIPQTSLFTATVQRLERLAPYTAL